MKYFAVLAAVLPLAAAHYHFPQLIVNGKVTGWNEYVRGHDNGYMPHDNDNGLNSNEFRCNKGSENYAKKTKAYTVKAGVDSVGFVTNLNAKIQHPGPMTIYLSKAPGDVANYDGSGDWFKVWQIDVQNMANWNGKDDGWRVWNKDKFEFKLPAEIPAGQYLMRIEHMATHPPYSGKEWFFQCAHLNVQSSYSGAAPKPTVRFPGAYQKNTPSVAWDGYGRKPPFPLHGPAMWPNNNNYNVNLA